MRGRPARAARVLVAVSDIEPVASRERSDLYICIARGCAHARVSQGIRLVVGCTGRARPRHRLRLRRHELPDVAVVPNRRLPGTHQQRQRYRSRAGGSLVIVGRIVTMDEPPIAEALLIEEGRVTCVGIAGRGAGAGR